MRSAPLTALVLLLTLALAACGGDDGAPVDTVTAGTGTTATADAAAAADPAAGSSLAGSEGAVPVEGEGGIGDGTTGGVPDTAPPFGVSSETDSTSLPPFTSCWSAGGTAVCSDGVAAPTSPLAAEAQLVVTYVEGELTAESSAPLTAEGTDPGPRSALPVVMENPGIWLVDVSGLPAGQHTVWLSWTGEPGDASAAITLDVA